MKQTFKEFTDILICKCYNVEHQLVFRYNTEDNELYMSVHLCKCPWWQRLIYGIRYIFGYKCMYGAFDEFIFNPDDTEKLERIVERLKRMK